MLCVNVHQRFIKLVEIVYFAFYFKFAGFSVSSRWSDALRIVTGCLRPTPTDHLPVLSGIQPAEVRRMGATLSLAYRGSLDPNHILHGLLSGSSDTRQRD